MLIQLVGFMGCGKSTLGPLLALCLGLPFKDLDRVVEEEAGQSIASLFNTGGEAAFRTRERQAFLRLKEHFHGVLALGGGLPCQPGMAPFVAQAGPCIFLDVAEDALLARLRCSRDARPLLADLDERELEQTVRRLLAERRPHYESCGTRVALSGRESLPETLDLLLASLKERDR